MEEIWSLGADSLNNGGDRPRSETEDGSLGEGDLVGNIHTQRRRSNTRTSPIGKEDDDQDTRAAMAKRGAGCGRGPVLIHRASSASG